MTLSWMGQRLSRVVHKFTNAKAWWAQKSDWILYQGKVPVSHPVAMPSTAAYIKVAVSGAGTVTVVGTLAGVTKTDSHAIAAGGSYRFAYAIDTLTSVTTTGTGTIAVWAVDSGGNPIQHTTNKELIIQWQDGGQGYWDQTGVWTTPVATTKVREYVPIGTTLHYDRAVPSDPTNGKDYLVKGYGSEADELSDGFAWVLKLGGSA